ncbi:MAG: hypothetical protein WAV40_02220 [Microgenomates group bacterium]
MLSISHAATGAFIAVKIGNPWLAIPLILLSHYLEDAIPHWDAGTGLGSGKKTRLDAFNHGVIDLALAGLVVLAMYYSRFPIVPNLADASVWNFAPYWGAFFGLLPDFLEAPRNFLHYEPWFLKPLNKFHHSFHHSIPRMIDGLAPQLLLLTILWFFR